MMRGDPNRSKATVMSTSDQDPEITGAQPAWPWQPFGPVSGLPSDPNWHPGSPLPPAGGFPSAGTPDPSVTPDPAGMPDSGAWAAGAPDPSVSQPFAPWAPWAPPAAPASPAPPRRSHRSLLVLAAVALLGVATAAGVGIGHAVWPPTSSTTAQGGTGTQAPSSTGGTTPVGGSGGSSLGGGSGSGATGTSSPSDVSSIAAKVDPALVDVNSTFTYQQAQGAGTGIVVTSTGEVITNNHVVNGATKISVTDLGNGKSYSATVVGYDSTHDIAVLQLQGASGLKTATFADSSKLAVGESVVAIGNVGGTGGTPTTAGGSITALNQSITASDDLDGTSERLSGLIQVNADIQAGDSGGSLVSNSGAVIGMDTAGSSSYSFQASASTGYAIPINQVLATAAAIEAAHGSSVIHVGATAFVGVLISTSGQGGFGSGGSGSGTSGAQLSGVVSGGPAAKAGLVAGDVITSFDGQTVTSESTISSALVGLHPGDRVELGWVDTSGQSHTATVQLASGPPA
jgi:S1-C subfamily serine protease